VSTLTLTYSPEDEWHGEITAVVDSAGYIGRASAWFTVEELRSFADSLVEYPIKAEAPLSLNGGFWEDEAIDQIHVGISVVPYDSAGGLVVALRLATPVWTDAGRNRHHSLVAHLRTDYACLDAFRTSFISMVGGDTDAAVLNGQ
jgi:hypothetical protein